MDAHLDNGVKREHPAPFLMTKNDEEKEVLRIFRELSPENKNTIMLLLKSLAQQKAPSEDGEDFSGK
jgi:hypothetical protein